jgi:drug/metabolite transporter (DMT)-like permease
MTSRPSTPQAIGEEGKIARPFACRLSLGSFTRVRGVLHTAYWISRLSPAVFHRLPLVKTALGSAPVLIAGFCILWSSAFSISKIALADCPPILFLAIRCLLAGAIMLAAALACTSARLSRKDCIAFAALLVLNGGIYLSLSLLGLGHSQAGFSALIVSAKPILAILLAALFCSERLSGRQAMGLLLGCCVALLIGAHIVQESAEGVAMPLAALISVVMAAMLLRRLAPQGGLWLGSAIQNLAAGVALLPFALTLEAVGEVAPSWRLIGILGYLVVFVSIAALFFLSEIRSQAGQAAANSYHGLTAPLGLLFGWLVLGEQTGLFDLAAVVPVIGGIYLVTRPASFGDAEPAMAKQLNLIGV